jgi:hypothetical protein
MSDDPATAARTPEEILATGAAWITEAELERLVAELAAAREALDWIKEFAEKSNAHGIAHPGFTHVARKARAALEASSLRQETK